MSEYATSLICGLSNLIESVQVSAFVFQRPPSDPAAALTHRDFDLRIEPYLGEPRSLIGVEDFLPSVFDRCLDAETPHPWRPMVIVNVRLDTITIFATRIKMH